MRGEKWKMYRAMLIARGSPPRARGKDAVLVATRSTHGITPACAGKRAKINSASCACGDHPRACGEKKILYVYHSTAPGSPPRVRGKAQLRAGRAQACGITPARAGKSRSSCRPGWACRDHPRACGEKLQHSVVQPVLPGSPPRVRGKGHLRTTSISNTGITPARAGKSTVPFLVNTRNKDHPRACGEKFHRKIKRSLAKGSPPRVRGKGYCFG